MTATPLAGNATLRTASEPRDMTDFEAAFDRCSPGLYRFIVVRIGGDAHLANDMMQSLWIKASRQGNAVPAGEVEFWLRAIARNLVREHWRKTARRPDHAPIADPALAGELAERLICADMPAEIVERRETKDQLLLAITGLPAADQALIIGHYFDGRSHAELADELGAGERAIEGRLYRARQALRTKLKHLDEEGW